MDIAVLSSNSAVYCVALGDLATARDFAGDGLRFARQAELGLYTAIALQHLALLAALSGHGQHAARLLGYVDAKYAELGYEREGTEQWGYDKLIAALGESLSHKDNASFAAQGARWSEDQAVLEAMSD